MKSNNQEMKFFYNPDSNCPLTKKEQEYYYCYLRDSIRGNHKSISLVKRVYSIIMTIDNNATKYAVGENASAIFESDEHIIPASYYIFSDGRGFWLSPPPDAIVVEYFEPVYHHQKA
jgi:hypothetical protein